MTGPLSHDYATIPTTGFYAEKIILHHPTRFSEEKPVDNKDERRNLHKQFQTIYALQQHKVLILYIQLS